MIGQNNTDAMAERLLHPEEYTPEIIEAVASIQWQMDNTLTSYTDDTIKVFENEGTIYVLANPILGEERVINSEGDWETVPLYNVTLMRPKDWISCQWVEDEFRVSVKQPKFRILRPDLCKRINKQ